MLCLKKLFYILYIFRKITVYIVYYEKNYCVQYGKHYPIYYNTQTGFYEYYFYELYMCKNDYSILYTCEKLLYYIVYI